jgi:hypothetical protein
MDVLMPLALLDGLIAGNEVPRRVLVTDDFSEALVADILPRLNVEVKREISLPEEELEAKDAMLILEKELIEQNEKENAKRQKKRKGRPANII